MTNEHKWLFFTSMKIKNHILKRPNKKPILWDAFFNSNATQKPLVIFCHGYKGFKDWGAWDLVAQAFADAGFFFVKFNFSHNGGTMEEPIDFPDLEAFAENNYSKELEDLKDVMDYFHSMENPFYIEINPNSLILIGHSRGGGIAAIMASEDNRISQLITWASVGDFGNRMGSPTEIEQWKQEGVKYVLNARTKQQMPHNFQFYEDFKANEIRLTIASAIKNSRVRHLIIHATEDPSVSFQEAKNLKTWNPQSELIPIMESDHVFGATHPWSSPKMPEKLQTVVSKTIHFIKTNLTH